LASLALQQPGAPQDQPGQPPAQGPEASPNTPVTQTPQERKQAFGLNADHEKSLIKIWKDHVEDWAIPRRNSLRTVLRHIEYDKGNQYINWDPFTTAYVSGQSAFQMPGQQGTENGNIDLANLYQCKFNIISWLKRNWISTFPVPGVEWWPGDSESDLDNRASQARGRSYQKIAFENKEKEFFERVLNSLFLTGSYFRYIRWSMDKDITGVKYEPTLGWQPKTIAPDRYTCPDCGADNPANQQTAMQGGTQCMNCGKPLNSAHFYPAATLNLPVVTGHREVPRGQVLWDAFSLLNVQVMPQANTNGGGVIANTPILDLQLDWTKGSLRRCYPGAWEELQQERAGGSGNQDGEIARIARMRARTPGQIRTTYISQNMPETHQVWFTPDSIAALDDHNKMQELMDLVTRNGAEAGCKALIFHDKIIDIQHDDVRKRWTWCGAAKDVGACPPAPVAVAMDFQDRINDRTNTIDEFHDRAGSPPLLYSKRMLGEGLNGKFLPPATLMGIDDNAEVGMDMTKAFFQPKFEMNDGIYKWVEELFQKVQLLCGIPPQVWGGSDPNVRTKGGQEQALKTARSTQQQYWNQLRGETVQAANLSVDCFAANATDDDYAVAKPDDAPDFQNEPIRLADLAGKADARPVAAEDYPIDYEQQREIFQQLIGMTSGREPNPLVMEMLDTYENRRIALRFVGPADMELPETAAHDKVLQDIQALLTSQPVPAMAPMTGPDGQPMIDPTGQPAMQQIMKPSVEPDQRFDSLDEVTVPTVMRYAMLHYKELRANPNGMQNLELYFDLAVQYAAKKKAAQGLLSTNAPGWQGRLGAPAVKGSPAGGPAAPGQ